MLLRMIVRRLLGREPEKRCTYVLAPDWAWEVPTEVCEADASDDEWDKSGRHPMCRRHRRLFWEGEYLDKKRGWL